MWLITDWRQVGGAPTPYPDMSMATREAMTSVGHASSPIAGGRGSKGRVDLGVGRPVPARRYSDMTSVSLL